MKRRFGFNLATLFSAAAIFGAWLWMTRKVVNSVKVIEINSPAVQPAHDDQEQSTKRRRLVTWDRSFAAIVALAAAFQAGVIYYQWGEMKKQAVLTGDANTTAEKAANAATRSNQIASDTAERDQRAYVNVVIDNNPKLQPLENGLGYTLELKYQNAGKTPAFNVVMSSGMDFKPFHFDGPFETPVVNGANMFVGPNRIWTNLMKCELDSSQVSAIKAGTHAIWVVGKITYRDAFGKSHRSEFRFRQFDAGELLTIEKIDGD